MLFSGGQVVAHSPNDYGDRTPLLSPSSSWTQHTSIPLLEAHATYGEIYRRHQWVATLVNKVAFAQARLPYKTYRPGPNGRESTADQAFGTLMRRPYPRDGRFFFWLWNSSTAEVHGEALLIKVRSPRTKLPVALWPMHPANMDVRRASSGGGWEYVWKIRGLDGQEVVWSADDVVHFKSFNPDTMQRGMSRLEPLRRSLLAEEAVQAAQESFWRRGARPSMVLEHPKELSSPAITRLSAQFDEIHAGASNWGRPAVLEEGMKANVIQLSAEEMQMIASRKISREEACAMYDVPPPVVHILDRATFSNVTEQMRSMYRDTMGSRLGLYESVIDEQVAAEFGDRDYGKFLMDEVLRGDFEQRMDAYAKGINFGIYKPQEVRRKEELPDAGPEAEQLYMSAAMIPMKAAAQSQPRAAKGIRSALGRLSRTPDLSAVDLGSVTKGLDPTAAEAVAVHLAAAVARGGDVGDLRAALAAELNATPEEAA